MNDREVVRKLKRAARVKINCDRDRENEIIAAVLKREVPVPKEGGFGEFLLSQFGFLGKMAFFCQLLWLLLFVYAVWDGSVFHFSGETLCVLSMAPPLLLLLTAEEVARIYNRSMLEIEYATKYSLRKVVMGRLLIVSVLNGAVLVVGMIFAGSKTGLSCAQIIAYGLTPFSLMTLLLLSLMEKWKGEQLCYAAISVYAVLLAAVLVGRMEAFNIYSPRFLGVWLFVLAASALGSGCQTRRLWRVLGDFEQVM